MMSEAFLRVIPDLGPDYSFHKPFASTGLVSHVSHTSHGFSHLHLLTLLTLRGPACAAHPPGTFSWMSWSVAVSPSSELDRVIAEIGSSLGHWKYKSVLSLQLDFKFLVRHPLLLSNSCDPVDCVARPRLFGLWDFPGKNTGVGCYFLLQGIFPTQESKPCLLLGRQILYHWATQEELLGLLRRRLKHLRVLHHVWQIGIIVHCMWIMHLLSPLFGILHCLNIAIIPFSLFFSIKKYTFGVISQILKYYILLSPSSHQLLKHIISSCATKRKIRCFLHHDTVVVIRYNLVFRNVKIEK